MADPRQRFRDLLLLLKQERKAQVIAGIIILVLLWSIIGEPPQRRLRLEEDVAMESGAMGNDEAYEDLVKAFKEQLGEVKKDADENRQVTKELKEGLQQFEERTAEIFKKVIERMADLENAAARWGGKGDGAANVTDEELQGLPKDELSPFGDLDRAEVEVPAPPKPNKIAVIGAGDSVRVKLLAGVHAPVDGTPYPVVFELTDDVIGPDGSSLPLGGARLIAAAQGSITDQRALFRLHTLNVRMPDGSRKVLDVDGWVVGEDGIRGMEGILIDPIGKAMAGALLAGTVEGVGEGLAQRNTTFYYGSNGITAVNNGDLWDYAAGHGVSKAAEKWSDFIEEREKMMVPHVRVLSGRSGTAVFSRSRAIEGLFEAMEDEESTYAALD